MESFEGVLSFKSFGWLKSDRQVVINDRKVVKRCSNTIVQRFLFYRRICGALQVLASQAVGLALKLVLNIKESSPQKREFSRSAPASYGQQGAISICPKRL